MGNLKAPFPWFGGKSRVADLVWERLGSPPNYVEPFFGSGAVLLSRPGGAGKTETVNDADGFIANFWRAIKFAPDHVSHWADWPVNENDLHARNFYLSSLRYEFCKRLEGDPTYYDPLIAGWWVWGLSCWIGSGFAQWTGPWRSIEGLFVRGDDDGVKRQLPHLGDAGQGVTRKLPHLGDAGRGIVKNYALQEWFSELSERMARIRVCCGDWARCLGDSVTEKHGLTAIFLDPPYESDGRETVYAKDDGSISGEVLKWCLDNGHRELLRIALCGYEREDYSSPLEAAGWTKVAWKAAGGFGSQGNKRGRDNCTRERIWFSPHCIDPAEQLSLELPCG